MKNIIFALFISLGSYANICNKMLMSKLTPWTRARLVKTIERFEGNWEVYPAQLIKEDPKLLSSIKDIKLDNNDGVFFIDKGPMSFRLNTYEYEAGFTSKLNPFGVKKSGFVSYDVESRFLGRTIGFWTEINQVNYKVGHDVSLNIVDGNGHELIRIGSVNKSYKSDFLGKDNIAEFSSSISKNKILISEVRKDYFVKGEITLIDEDVVLVDFKFSDNHRKDNFTAIYVKGSRSIKKDIYKSQIRF